MAASGWADMRTWCLRWERGFCAQPILGRMRFDRGCRTVLSLAAIVRLRRQRLVGVAKQWIRLRCGDGFHGVMERQAEHLHEEVD
jgi:hypothetical protein